MTLQLTLVLLLWTIGVGSLGLLAQIQRRGQTLRRPALSLIAVASALYAFGNAIELSGDSLARVYAAFSIQYVAIAPFPLLVLWLAARFARSPWLRRRAWRWVAATLSLATLVLVFTNPWHDLFHANARMDASGPFAVVVFERGVAYWAFQLYAAAALLIVNALLLRAWWTAHGSRRAQARLLATASLVPWLGMVVNAVDPLPLPLDVMPFLIPVTTLLLYRGLVLQGLGHLSPIARDLVFERMGDAALVLDPDGRVLDQNQAAVALLGPLTDQDGMEPNPLLADRFPALASAIAATDTDLEEASVYQTLRDEPSEVVIAGRTYSARLVELREGRRRHLGRVLVLRDITRYVEMDALMRTLATTDELTGIPNRRHFLDLAGRDLERARRSGRPITLLVFDLDRFKRVNDTYGHQIGDTVLRTVAAAVVTHLRSTDAVGRYGGEEFAVCLPDADAHDAARIAERIRAEIARALVPAGQGHVQVSASVGTCTMAGPEMASLEVMLGRADEAQYRAKALGGDVVVAWGDDGAAPRGPEPALEVQVQPA